MPQLRQQDSAMWSCQQYCSAVSAQFSARSGHSLETWGVPPPQSPQLWVRRDRNITKAASVGHGTYLFTLVAMFLAVCLCQFFTIVILIEAGEARSSSLVSTQSTGLGFVREWYEMVITIKFAIRLTFLQTSLLLWQLLSSTK